MFKRAGDESAWKDIVDSNWSGEEETEYEIDAAHGVALQTVQQQTEQFPEGGSMKSEFMAAARRQHAKILNKAHGEGKIDAAALARLQKKVDKVHMPALEAAAWP